MSYLEPVIKKKNKDILKNNNIQNQKQNIYFFKLNY